MARQELLEFTDRGIYCPAGDFYIDPWKPVERAVITHAHADHARAGHKSYLAHTLTTPILRLRLGRDIVAESLAYAEPARIGDVKVSLHPAGHIPGSAQVRLERAGEVWVVAGDYKVSPDGLSTPWEPVACHAFITESTFGLPIYKWPNPTEVADEMRSWWKRNRAAEKTSVITAYSLGKAQRILHLLASGEGEIFVHPTIREINLAFRDAGLELANLPTWEEVSRQRLRTALLVLPPGALDKALRQVGRASTAAASGWMTVRGNRRRLALDRGFVLSDHADWTELNQAVKATGADRIFVTHGQVDAFVRWFRDQGREAHPVPTRFSGEEAEEENAAGKAEL